MNKTYAGYVAIIGRPNAGKSTLLNRLIGQKISIVSRKAQTTRHRILGVDNFQNYQTVYLDTPGVCSVPKNLLTTYTNQVAYQFAREADLIIWITNGTKWDEGEDAIAEKLQKINLPVLLLINKIDLIKQPSTLTFFKAKMEKAFHFEQIITFSAKYSPNLEELKESIRRYLPENPWYFPQNQLTDRSKNFFIAEVIREKLIRLLGGELPYSLTVMVDKLEENQKVMKILATIYVERRGQRVIIIGDKGEKIKEIGILSRIDLEKHFGQKVFLSLWVKVKKNWTRDAKTLLALGYDEV